MLAPVTETGWDTVLREAKDAGIPVIIVDRKVDVEDDSLFTCFVGSDFELEGLKMSEWLNSFSVNKGIAPQDIHIVNIQGNIGASARSDGPGDWNRAWQNTVGICWTRYLENSPSQRQGGHGGFSEKI